MNTPQTQRRCLEFDVRRDEIFIAGSDQPIGIYSYERSNADAFRLRGEVGYELPRMRYASGLAQWAIKTARPARS